MTCCNQTFPRSYSNCCPEPVSEVTFNVVNYNEQPIGQIFSYLLGIDLPSGALPCDGRAVSRSMYPDLFTAIGTTYGAGDGTTTFNLPNLTHHDSALQYLIQVVDNRSVIATNRRIPKISVTVDGGLTTATAVIQIVDSNEVAQTGVFGFRVWFADDLSSLGAPTFVPPSVPGFSEADLVTDTEGKYTMTISSTGRSGTWYLCAKLDSEVIYATVSVNG